MVVAIIMVIEFKIWEMAIQLTCATKHAINMIGAIPLMSTKKKIIIVGSWLRDVLMLE